MERKNIYLDYAATTPLHQRVYEAMKPYWHTNFGNASSVHQHGQIARSALEKARLTIANTLDCNASEIIFTGCGTESDNLAIRGVMWAAREMGRGNHLITSVIEHKAVLKTAKHLRDHHGFELSVIPVDEYGVVDLSILERSVRSDTVLVSIMSANNEIGTIQPVEEIGAIAKERGILFHTDAIQAASMWRWNLSQMPIDMISLSAHKFYGPKGVGILYLRKGIEIFPYLTGGGQENGLRGGTSMVPLAVGAAAALNIAAENGALNNQSQSGLRDRLIEGILSANGDDCILTGHPTKRLSNNASFAFRDLDGNELLMHLDINGISASSGSACLTGNPEPSEVLRAIGLDDAWSKGGLRLTVGKYTSESDIDFVLNVLPQVVRHMKVFSRRAL